MRMRFDPSEPATLQDLYHVDDRRWLKEEFQCLGSCHRFASVAPRPSSEHV